MRVFRTLVIALPVAAGALCIAAAAGPGDVLQNYVDKFALPRFAAVATQAKAQQDAWVSYCAGRDHGDPETLRGAYNAVADAWANIEFERMGPGAEDLRVERFNYWLDRKDETGRALTAMLDAENSQSLDAARFGIAAQGLPVLERLLYDKDVIARSWGADGARRCAVGQAVAHSLSNIADAIMADWTGPDGARAAIAANRRWKNSFANADDAARGFLTDINTEIEELSDRKLAMLYHDEANRRAPRLAEDSRSRRSLRDAAIDLEAVRQACYYLLSTISSEQMKELDAAFDDSESRLKAAMEAEDDANTTSAKRMALIDAARTSLSNLQQTSLSILTAAMGTSLGLSNSDGD